MAESDSTIAEPGIAGQPMLVAGTATATAAAIASAAARRGARVILAVRHANCVPASPAVLWIPYADDSEAAVETVVDAAVDHAGTLRIVVIVLTSEAVPAPHECSVADWVQCVERPLCAAFWLARRALHEFLAAGDGGRLIFVVEPALDAEGRASNPIVETAVHALARSVAREYGRRAVTCNVVLSQSGPGAPDAVAELALFLASPQASFVTGERLPSGGTAGGCK